MMRHKDKNYFCIFMSVLCFELVSSQNVAITDGGNVF